jgi:hypothetical protein
LGGVYRRDLPPSFSFWEAGYKVSWKKAHICQNTVKYLGFHLLQGQGRVGPKRKQAVCPFQSPRPAGRSGSFCEPQVSVKSGSLSTPLANPSIKPKRGENRNLWYGERSNGKPLEKLRGHSQMPLL